MKKYFIICVVIIISAGFAQTKTAVDTTWPKQLMGSLNFSQAYFDNWVAGGENSMAGQFDLNGNIDYNNAKYKWSNTGKIAYGTSKIGDDEAKKTVDEIKLESVVSIGTKFISDPYLAIKAETQLASGYSYKDDDRTQISAFLDPAYFTQSIGLIYSPKEELSLRLGWAVKETLTNNYPDPFADDPKTDELEKIKIEPGIEAVIGFNKNISETTQIKSTLDLFNNFKGINMTDVKWDTDLSTRITQFINIKMSLKIFYDRDISKKRQINQAIMLGLSYAII